MWRWWTDQRAAQKPFNSQWVKETLTDKVFKLSHKSVAFRQIEQNGPFQRPTEVACQFWARRGPCEGLNVCIILLMGTESSSPFHTYRHLLGFLQFLWEAADGYCCFKKKEKKRNRRGNADWTPSCCVLLIDSRYVIALWAGERERKSLKDAVNEKQITFSSLFHLAFSFSHSLMFVGSFHTFLRLYKVGVSLRDDAGISPGTMRYCESHGCSARETPK